MDGWRGLMVLSIGLVIGVSLWLAVASLVAHPSSPLRIASAVGQAPAATQPAEPEGETAAIGANPIQEDLPPQPFPVTIGASKLKTLLQSAPFVHHGSGGPVLYVVTFRSCPACIAFESQEWAGLESAGVDIRWIVYARRDKAGAVRSLAPERALVADLALTRNYAVLDAWLRAPSADAFYQSAQLPPAAESSQNRSAALEQMRALVDNLSAVVAANGQDLGIPAFFWQQGDGWRGLVGYDQAAFVTVRAALLGKGASPTAANDSQ